MTIEDFVLYSDDLSESLSLIFRVLSSRERAVTHTLSVIILSLTCRTLRICACVGCHIAYHDAEWLVGVDNYSPEELGLTDDQEPPDISLGTRCNTLQYAATHCNTL